MRISSTQISMYQQCPRKYQLWYKKGFRPKVGKGALLFGSAIDRSLNHLLQTRNLQEAQAIFLKEITTQDINKVGTFLPKATNVVYAESDFDYELLTPEDIQKYIDTKIEFGLDSTDTMESDIKFILKKKGTSGFDSLEEVEKRLYSIANWLGLRAKGRIMIDSYYTKVMPKIKNVLAVQKQGILKNETGDEIVLYLDMIVELHDGTRWLMDNKTSARDYAKDSPMKSQQLIIYYHSEKAEYNLKGVGFYVMYKQITKNRVKICSKCSHDGSGASHRSCPVVPDGGKKKDRCNGTWNESISPECRIDILMNEVPEGAENLVMETCDQAREGIQKEAFGPNLNACGDINSDWRCPMYNKCWKNDGSDLIKTNVYL